MKTPTDPDLAAYHRRAKRLGLDIETPTYRDAVRYQDTERIRTELDRERETARLRTDFERRTLPR